MNLALPVGQRWQGHAVVPLVWLIPEGHHTAPRGTSQSVGGLKGVPHLIWILKRIPLTSPQSGEGFALALLHWAKTLERKVEAMGYPASCWTE